jgi:Amt family ammonium transporter
MLGAGLLWFGWFGFNAGSELAADATAGLAWTNTLLATCAALLGWLLVERIRTGSATTLGAASGAVCGLVAITPACGFVNSMGAIVVGLAGGVVGVLAVSAKYRLGYDDSLDVVGVHGACGVVGTVLIGVFATSAVNGGITDEGLVSGGSAHLLGVQALAVLVTIAWAFTVTWLVAQLVQRTVGLRVTDAVEVEGLDTAIHGESAYDFGNVRAGRVGY